MADDDLGPCILDSDGLDLAKSLLGAAAGLGELLHGGPPRGR